MPTPRELADRLLLALRQHVEPATIIHRIPLETAVWQCGTPASLEAARRASFEPVHTGWRWGPVWSSAWFRLRVTLPVGVSSQKLSLRFSAGTEATVWGYHDGKPIPLHGLDLNHTLVPLALALQGGITTADPAHVELYIEAACNRPLGATTFFWDNPAEVEQWQQDLPGILEFSELIAVDPKLDRLLAKLRFAASLLTTVDESSSTLVDLESIVCRVEQHVQSFPTPRATDRCSERSVRDATTWLPAPTVQSHSRWHEDQVGSVLDQLADDLLSLVPGPPRPASPHRSTCRAVGHAHIDTAWLWKLSETRRKCLRTFATALHLLDQHPEFRFVCTQAQQYAWVEEDCPPLFEKIRRQVLAGRWEPGGAMWIEPDCNLPSGESFIRQIIHGTRYWRERFGDHAKQTYLYLPDTFGFPASLPQIIAGCGLKTFIFNKLWWNETNPPPFSAFEWEGIDGTCVVSYLTPGMEYNATMTPPELRKGDTNHREKDPTAPSEWLQPFGFGNGGGGPTHDMIRAATFAEKTPSLPHVRFTRIDEFCESLHVRVDAMSRVRVPASGFRVPAAGSRTPEAGTRSPHPRNSVNGTALPLWPEHELYLERHRGTYTTQAWIKKANRRAEDALRLAECLAFAGPIALSPEQSQQTRTLLDEAWKLTLLNQFHDILPGSSIGPVYDEAGQQYVRIQAICNEIINQSRVRWCEYESMTNQWTGRPARSDSLPLQPGGTPGPRMLPLPPGGTPGPRMSSVFNPCSSPRSGVVEIGGTLAFVSDVPPLGIRTINPSVLVSSPLPSVNSRVAPVLYTVFIGVPNSPITLSNAIIECRINPDGTVDGLKCYGSSRAFTQPLNILAMYEDQPKYWEAWDIDKDYAEHPVPISAPDVFKVFSADPLRVVIEVSRPLGSSSRITQRFILDAGSPRLDVRTTVDWHESRKLLRVQFPTDLYASHATYDIQFGHVQRSTSGDDPINAARFEVCAHRWMDLSEPPSVGQTHSQGTNPERERAGSANPANNPLPDGRGSLIAASRVSQGGLGLAILNDCKYGHSCRGGLMGLTLLRSTKFPDKTADMGMHECTYSLMPHNGDWRAAGVDKEAESLNRPLIVWDCATSGPDTSGPGVPPGKEPEMNTAGTPVPLSIVPANPATPLPEPALDWSPFTLNTEDCGVYVEIAAVKPGEDSNSLIVRLVETRGIGRRLQMRWTIPVQSVHATDLIERAHVIADLQHDADQAITTMTLKPFQIVTIKAERRTE